jgi:hypothetical protein
MGRLILYAWAGLCEVRIPRGTRDFCFSKTFTYSSDIKTTSLTKVRPAGIKHFGDQSVDGIGSKISDLGVV